MIRQGRRVRSRADNWGWREQEGTDLEDGDGGVVMDEAEL